MHPVLTFTCSHNSPTRGEHAICLLVWLDASFPLQRPEQQSESSECSTTTAISDTCSDDRGSGSGTEHTGRGRGSNSRGGRIKHRCQGSWSWRRLRSWTRPPPASNTHTTLRAGQGCYRAPPLLTHALRVVRDATELRQAQRGAAPIPHRIGWPASSTPDGQETKRTANSVHSALV